MTAAIKAMYVNGLNGVEQLVSSAAWSREEDRALAVELLGLAHARATWAYTDANGDIFALEDGVIGDALLIGMDPATAATRPATLSTDTNVHPVRIYMAKAAMSSPWAGVALMHELIHVRDVLLGVEPAEPTPKQWIAGEARAFRFEIALVDAITGGALKHALDAAAWVRIPDEAINVQSLLEVAHGVSEALNIGAPASPQEHSQRLAFCAVAAVLHQRGALAAGEPGADQADLEFLAAL